MWLIAEIKTELDFQELTHRIVLLSLLVAENSIAQQGINGPPDTIFFNGKIITVDSGFTIQQAFAVRGDQYVAVGTNAAIRALAGANTRLVELKGSAVIPGLSDNHDHLPGAVQEDGLGAVLSGS